MIPSDGIPAYLDSRSVVKHVTGHLYGHHLVHSRGRLAEEIRPPTDLAESGKDLYEREFVAFQKSLFERLLRETGGNRAEAARRLGWRQNSFRRRCSELGLE